MIQPTMLKRCSETNSGPVAAQRRRPRDIAWSVVLCLSAYLSSGGCAVPLSSPCNETGAPANATLQEMLDNLNAYRAANGLPALTYSTKLAAAAGAHAQDMAVRNFIDHINPDGEAPADRVASAGSCVTSIGENIAVISNSTADDAQAGWEGSANHDANMRSTAWSYVGMGHYSGANGAEYWVQVFGG